mmetsp:Transcript_8517/g.24434  ORF Transcript_8517/g.24434 Transcript_8517/m.24434 type:complete len:324 (+) Transcript_8517:169-1140(+)|eukprot:CAMPEP_0117680224 /NCGR_PEP_ID=MMETSP0804-20121206/18231_1 /TAXON_ID=1074897 /ORGANISM="Tetraselmis astigmatica, Strain CCMP880" /LENGTH=323 /DNA_ID=CAMNT_0005489693 /DNA_START=157 /DNA_END=1128 /DNA_ORIENTATION=+
MAALASAVAPSEVRPGLYIGGLGALSGAASLSLTHILSLADGAEALFPDAEHKHISIEDMEDNNILKHLEGCCSYVSEALSRPGGAVLVHCNAGVSRSTAVVIAYLMRSEKRSTDAALEALREAHPAAQPNDGFMEQLRLFHEMGCRLDPTNEAYKRFNLQQHGRRWEAQGYVDREQLQDVAQGDVGDSDSSMAVERYRCRSCRTVVASSLHSVDVEQGPGQGAFPFYKRAKQKAAAQDSKDSSLFVEPLRWMESAIAQHNGKLYCPTCSERLGSFSWSGIQSNSGSWVVPAFQLHMSKLDTISPAFDTALMGAIRQPRAAPL